MSRRYAHIMQRLGGRCRQTGAYGLEGVLRSLVAHPDATSTAQHSLLFPRPAANPGSSTESGSVADVTGCCAPPRPLWSLSVLAHPSAAPESLPLKRAFHASSGLRMGVPEPSEPEAEQRSPPSDRVLRLVDEIAELNLLEVADLTQLLKRKLGLPDMPMGGMMMPMQGMMPAGGAAGGAPGGGAGGQAEEPAKAEKTSFDVKLEKFDASAKLKIIKEVRAITGLGLKESKELVEGAPAVIKKSVPKEEAESLVEKLKAVGAQVSLE